MTEKVVTADPIAHGDVHAIHLPPNSWVPLSVALSMALTFVGMLIAPPVWVAGLIWLVGSLVAWFRGARSEYLDLPEQAPKES